MKEMWLWVFTGEDVQKSDVTAVRTDCCDEMFYRGDLGVGIGRVPTSIETSIKAYLMSSCLCQYLCQAKSHALTLIEVLGFRDR